MKTRTLAFALLLAFPAACAENVVEDDYDAGTRDPRDAARDAVADATVDGPRGDASEDGTVRDTGADAVTADGQVDATTDAADATTDAADAGTDAADATVDATDASDAAVDATDGGADAKDGAVVVPPIVDGTINAGEYGVHTNGQNQQSSVGTTWYMTWTDSTLYVAIDVAAVAEAAVLYIGPSAIAPDAGTTNDGSSTGYNNYDGTFAGGLPFRATFVAYVKSDPTSYNEYRTWNGVDWNTVTKNTLPAVFAAGNRREFSIPWTAIRPAGRPASFAWLGYVTTKSGFVYATVPPGNPPGQVDAGSMSTPFFYRVDDATPGSGSKPFALRLP